MMTRDISSKGTMKESINVCFLCVLQFNMSQCTWASQHLLHCANGHVICCYDSNITWSFISQLQTLGLPEHCGCIFVPITIVVGICISVIIFITIIVLSIIIIVVISTVFHFFNLKQREDL